MADPAGFDVMALLPLTLLGIPVAIAAYWISPKMGARRWLWTLLLLIPVLNFFFISAFFIRIAGAILDRLNSINAPFDKLERDARS
jgi:hypothetical protein